MAEIWKALDFRGNSITTVLAEDAQEATAEAERQLTLNASRLFCHDSWVFGGRKVVTEEHLERAQAELRFRYECWQALWASEQVKLAAEKVSPDLFELGKRLSKSPDVALEWKYKRALIKLAGDLW